MHEENANRVPWKSFITITVESLLAFYISTFCMAMVFTHRNPYWVIDAIVLGILYAFVIVVCVKRVISTLSVATIMLIIPIAPFLALTMIISLIPIVQLLN